MTASPPPGAGAGPAGGSGSAVGQLPPLETTTGLTQTQLGALADTVFDKYCLRLARLARTCTHDGQPVRFYDDQLQHAFQVAANQRRRGWAKDGWDESRIQRASWIVPTIAGMVDGTKCYLVTDHSSADRPPPTQRLYVVRRHNYLVYLINKASGWSFKTAFVANGADIDRRTSAVTRGGVTYPAPVLIWSR